MEIKIFLLNIERVKIENPTEYDKVTSATDIATCLKLKRNGFYDQEIVIDVGEVAQEQAFDEAAQKIYQQNADSDSIGVRPLQFGDVLKIEGTRHIVKYVEPGYLDLRTGIITELERPSHLRFTNQVIENREPNSKEVSHGITKLDQPSESTLAGVSTSTIPGTDEKWDAGSGTHRGGRDDVSGDRATRTIGIPAPRSLDDDAGEIPISTGGNHRERRSERTSSINNGHVSSPAGSEGREEPRGRLADPIQQDIFAFNSTQNNTVGNSSEKPHVVKQPLAKPSHNIAPPKTAPSRQTPQQEDIFTLAALRADNYIVRTEDQENLGGAKTKYKNNVVAIRLIKLLQTENRPATRDEQGVLARYVGWGGIPQAFDPDNEKWKLECKELQNILTDDEYQAARRSTQDAHYTVQFVAKAMWQAVSQFGFKGGDILEPAVGTGHFLGLMPETIRANSRVTGVELDAMTGTIAKQLYPNANIQSPVGFQNFVTPDNYFDVVIGNPPFGSQKLYDGKRKHLSDFSIHNYFFAKSIDALKANGVLVMVVSNYLMDSTNSKAREYLSERAELVGAIRLPNDTFKSNAGTEVTTDILFLRKYSENERIEHTEPWCNVVIQKDQNGVELPLNEYFVRHPEKMLGVWGAFGSMYRGDSAALVARGGQNTPQLLGEAIQSLRTNIMSDIRRAPVKEVVQVHLDISAIKYGSMFLNNGKIHRRLEDHLGQPQSDKVAFASDMAKQRVKGMIEVRDSYTTLRTAQLQEAVSDDHLNALRQNLNTVYDQFVKTYGPINVDANKRLFRDDPTWAQIAALEDKFDKGVSATVAIRTGETQKKPTAKKAAIFSTRTQSPYKPPENAENAKDALVASLSEYGRIDMEYMSNLYGHTEQVIADELSGLIYRNPSASWETRDYYLSGNVKQKLAVAIDAAKNDPRYMENVQALEAVQPIDIEAVDINVKLGAHWIPAKHMANFVNHICGSDNGSAQYIKYSATWSLKATSISSSKATEWGTERRTPIGLMEAVANQKQIAVYDTIDDGTRIFNEKETNAASEKAERIKTEWRQWIWSDDDRREELVRIYNDSFNTDVVRRFDGAHLQFPGKISDNIIRLRTHQNDGIWRIVQGDPTLLDHVVGAGKTFTMIGAAMELRRMGLAKKPMFMVPNHLVGQWAVDFMALYPGANVLATSKNDFEKQNRKRLFARIATGDWDAVIVAHTSFGKVEMDPHYQEKFIKEQISGIEQAIKEIRVADGKKTLGIKHAEKQKERLEERLKRVFDQDNKDDNLYFGELGVDALFVDEAHEFKNLGFVTSMSRVAGLGNPMGSQKAADLFLKTQYLLEKTGGRNVVFATGTPISNTMAEMYTMQRYLQNHTMRDQGVAHFDAWAKMYGEVVTDWELSPSGKYKLNSRFSKFVNMPELMAQYLSFADVINRDDINKQMAAQGDKLRVPNIKGGKPQNIVVERSDDQAMYIGVPEINANGEEQFPDGSLVWRAENIPKRVKKGSDNMLKIMSDARKAALDMRLISPHYKDNPHSKIAVAAENIKKYYDDWHKEKGAQLVFIDLSTPKNARGKEAARINALIAKAEDGDEKAQDALDRLSPDELSALDSDFSVYDDLRSKIITKGIPVNEIAFIHDASTDNQKKELFGKVRSGRVRILFGSTAKMGAGTNVQERLVALHHMDAPWRPSDLEQREGRIIRQGNLLYEGDPEGFEVGIFRYATKQTLDSRMWQTIESKARFIEQVRKGNNTAREIEDVAGEAANAAEMKAASSGNPLILKEMDLRQKIRKLEQLQSTHDREQFRIKDKIRYLTDTSNNNKQLLPLAKQDSEMAMLAPQKFCATINDTLYDKSKEAGGAIIATALSMLANNEDSKAVGNYAGFTLQLDLLRSSFEDNHPFNLSVIGQRETQISIGNIKTASNVGLMMKISNVVKNMPEEAEQIERSIMSAQMDIENLKKLIKPWEKLPELTEHKIQHQQVIEELRPQQVKNIKQNQISKDKGLSRGR